MGGPEVRAETSHGAAYDAPSGALLLRLLDELGPGNQYLIVDRLDAPGAGHFMQVYREVDGTFAVEYREGAADRHFEAVTADLWQVHEALAAWATGAPEWRDAFDWRPWPSGG